MTTSLPGRVPSDVAELLAGLVREPGRPRVTWYGPDAERIELSGTVLANWVAKTTNLLVEEFDAGPGTRVLLDLPVHWRALVWALAAWRTGACVVTAPGTRADVVVTDGPERHPQAGALVAVALPALARSYPSPLPRGAVDAASAVMTYGDAVGWVPPTDPAADALAAPSGTVPHRALVAEGVDAFTSALPGTRDGSGPHRAALDAGGELAPLLLRALGAWAQDASLVLLAPGAIGGADAIERVLTSENVTVHVA